MMNKYEKALAMFNEYTLDYELNSRKFYKMEDFEEYKCLKELVDSTKPSQYYTKQQLLDELDLVYTLAKQNYAYKDYDVYHYADIYRLIERLVEDE